MHVPYNCRNVRYREPSISISGHLQPLRLSIVIPAYNEAARIPKTLSRLRGYLSTQLYGWEIVVVSNGSTDGTDEEVRRSAGDSPELRLITLSGRGKGLACRAGALESRGEVVFICDADLSMPPETLQRFLDGIEVSDVVVGSREAPGARRYSEPWHRHAMGRMFNWMVQILVVRGIRDTQCGFKAFRGPVARHLFSQQTVNGWGFDVELLFLAGKFGYSIEELPIDWYFDADSRVRPGVDTLTMLSEVCMIRWRSLLGRYETAPSSSTRTGGDVVR